jgi:hypothetical protein
MGCGNCRHFNLKSTIQTIMDLIFNNREQQVEMRRPNDRFQRVVEHHSTLAAERSN